MWQSLRAVLVLLRVEPAEESILEVESRVAQKEGVGMGCDVVFVPWPSSGSGRPGNEACEAGSARCESRTWICL